MNVPVETLCSSVYPPHKNSLEITAQESDRSTHDPKGSVDRLLHRNFV
jgi:hypothetical protein